MTYDNSVSLSLPLLAGDGDVASSGRDPEALLASPSRAFLLPSRWANLDPRLCWLRSCIPLFSLLLLLLVKLRVGPLHTVSLALVCSLPGPVS